MTLIKVWKRINPFSDITHANLEEGIYSENDFLMILERERSRADRDGSSFTLIVFDMENAILNGASPRHVLGILHKRRVRSTDEVGWFEKKIGVLLHNTNIKGAHHFANEVITAAPSIRYTVYAYPTERHNNYHEDRSFQEYSADEVSSVKRERGSRRVALFTQQATNGTLRSTNRPTWLQSEYSTGSILDLQQLFIRSIPTWKRVIDLFVAIVSIVILSPIMIVVAVAIKLTSKGPVLFRQPRSGLGGKPFIFYKFRSMVIDAEDKKRELIKFNERTGPVFKMSNDPRITTIGKFIRKWSIDELPQLFNVLFGDISLVGPRPPTLDEVPKYEKWQNRRLEVKPGITCIWQAYARHNKCFDAWVRMDIEYTRNQSFLFDLKLMFKTVPAVLSRKGAF